MISVITGDIINSTQAKDHNKWLSVLKDALYFLSHDKNKYEIFRGDSFQIEIEAVSKAFEAAVYIKACIKTLKNFDVRLSIGIGKKSYQGKTVSESNGSAFVNSGEAFENLKKERVNLKLKTNNPELDRELNLYFKLALIAMDNWTANSAEIVKLSFENPKAIQSELAKLIGISQDAVSKRQKRAYLDEIKELNQLYQEKFSNNKI